MLLRKYKASEKIANQIFCTAPQIWAVLFDRSFRPVLGHFMGQVWQFVAVYGVEYCDYIISRPKHDYKKDLLLLHKGPLIY